jgi:hypothetical protein
MTAAPLPHKGYPPGFASGIPLGEFSVATTYWNALTHPVTAPAAFHCIGVIIRDFFALQFFVHWGFRTIPVVSVDHPLDSLIPFRTDLSDRYLDFINFWIRGVSSVYTVLPRKIARPIVARWFRLLTKCYQEAAKLYRSCLTTTVRTPAVSPSYGDRRIRQIRAWDPHLCCVPSLHVAIVCLTWVFHRDLYRDKAALFSADTPRFEAELFRGAVTIIETVLYVKQHSVNCIPAALYMLCRIFPDLFSINDAVTVINALFAGDAAVTPKDRAAITDHIHFQFERLLLEGYYTPTWQTPVTHWLSTYTAS